MFSIVPHAVAAPGVDFCGVKGYHYIVRSDAGIYIKAENLNKGSDVKVFDLHYSCKGGDHYLANNGYFYIIKGKNYRRVTNMNTDADSVVLSLHPNCQGGDHYLSMCGKFYVIYKDRGVYRRTTNLNEDTNAVEYSLHPNCKDGLYFWGLDKYAYVIKPLGNWGPQYHKTSNMNHDWDSLDSSFTKHVVDFLPGAPGLTATTADDSGGGCKLDVHCSEIDEDAKKNTGIDCKIFMHFTFFVLIVVYISQKY
jgi:hypothetical protein